MKLGIIIPCFNEQDCLSDCLDSVLKSIQNADNQENISIYVCDNNSSDNSKKIIIDYCNKHNSVILCEESNEGSGLARAKAASIAFQNNADWIVSIDADCTVPLNWADVWYKSIKKTKYVILSGYSLFPQIFHQQFPTASKIFHTLSPFQKTIVDTVGITNLSGANHGISKKFYSTVGGYSQPTINENGKLQIIAGDDWDLGTKSRLLKKKIGFVDVFNITSDRRASIDIVNFINGIAYDGVLEPIRDRHIGEDVKEHEVKNLLELNKLRTIKHFFLKTLLVDNELISSPKTINLLGTELTSRIKYWIANNSISNIYEDRNKFIYGTLEAIQQEFGTEILSKIERSNGN